MFTALILVPLLAGAAAGPAPAVEPPSRDPNALVILAEIALERGDCKKAAESYLESLPGANAALAGRVSQVALACEHLPAAWQAAQRWRELAPRDTEAAALYAVVALRLHRIPDAQAGIRVVLESADIEPKLAELTVLLLEQAETPAVLAALAGAVDVDSASASVLSLLTELALNAHDLRRAERYAQLALDRDPQLFEARSLLSQIYARQGDGLNALAAARAAAGSDPKRGLFLVAQALVSLNRTQEAREEFERLRAEGGNAAEIDRRLALLSLQEGDLEDARRRFTAMVREAGVAESALFHIAEIDALEGEEEPALAGYRRLFDSSLAVTARIRAASLLLKRGKRAEALALLDEYAVEHPESGFDLTMTKAQLLSEHGETDTGLSLLTAALERHPKHPALEYDRAVLLEQAGQVREAVGALEQLLKERPDDATLLNALGYTLADHGLRLSHAEDLIRQALVITPDNPAVIDSLGWVRFKRGDAKGAVPILERAYALARDPEIAAHWGEALWKAGSKDEAREVWSGALELDPDSKALQTVIGRFVPPPLPPPPSPPAVP
jgi:tetratricopeptide (TPR) repeat protein